MTEKQAAAIAAELVKRIESRRAMKAAACSALEKTAFLGSVGRFIGSKFGPKAMKQVARTAGRRAGTFAAETADRVGAHGAARRIAPSPLRGAQPQKPVRTLNTLVNQTPFEYESLGKTRRLGFGQKMRRGWDNLTGANLRRMEARYGISPEAQLALYRNGEKSLKALRQAYKGSARSVDGYMDRTARDVVRDIGVDGGKMDRAILRRFAPGPANTKPGVETAATALLKRESNGVREALAREYYRRYRQMLGARAKAMGAVGLGGTVMYANRTADQAARSAYRAQQLPDGEGGFFDYDSDEVNKPIDEMNSWLEWLAEQNAQPAAGVSEADTGRGYNIR